MPILIYDHSHGKLESLGTAIGAYVAKASTDEAAANELILVPDSKVVFGHFDKDAWAFLCAHCSANDILVRFSKSASNELSAIPNPGSALLLKCRVSLSDLEEADLQLMATELSNSSVAQKLRVGIVAPALVRLFAFSNSSYLTALSILCQGYLIARGRPELLYRPSLSMPAAKPLSAQVRAKVTAFEWWQAPFSKSSLAEEITKEARTRGSDVAEVIEFLKKFHGGDEEAVGQVLTKINSILKQ